LGNDRAQHSHAITDTMANDERMLRPYTRIAHWLGNDWHIADAHRGVSPPSPIIVSHMRCPAAHHPSIAESGDRIQGNVRPTHDPTEDAMNFDEETRWV
jgi:hypothetical protein